MAASNSQVPEIMSTIGGVGQSNYGHQLNLPVNVNAARWASPDGDNSEPRIVAEPLRAFAMHGGNVAAPKGASATTKSTDLRNGMVMTGGMPIMEQLTLECDPNAWDLPADSLEYQRMMAHSCEFFLHNLKMVDLLHIFRIFLKL